MGTIAESRFLALLIDMRFSEDQVKRAVRLLISILGRTEAKAGCMECLVAQDATDEGHVRYSEKWGSESALHSHLRSAEFQRVLAAMDMCCQEPNVTIGDLSGKKGVAFLQALRDGEPGGTEGERHDMSTTGGADGGGNR